MKSHFSIGTHGSSEVRSDAWQGRSHSINGTGSDWTSSSSPAEPAQPGACCPDGYWFLKLLQAETEWLEGWCCQMDKETKENNLSEEVLGKVLSAVGSAQLLMSQKFQQFRGLCEQNLVSDSSSSTKGASSLLLSARCPAGCALLPNTEKVLVTRAHA